MTKGWKTVGKIFVFFMLIAIPSTLVNGTLIHSPLLHAQSDEDKENFQAFYPGLFSGGMLYHIAWIHLLGLDSQPQFVSKGLGGRLYFYVWKYIRVGGMGGVSTGNFGALDSSFRLGYGGFTLEGGFSKNRFEAAAGFLLGGQGLRIYDFETHLYSDTFQVHRIEVRNFIFTPLVSIDIWVSQKLKITSAFQLNIAHLSDSMCQTHIKGYLGILFSH